MDQFEKQIKQTAIPEELATRIESIAKKMADGGFPHPPSKKIAVFDLDNTLLDGDVGDAVFVQLKLDEQDEPITVDRRRIPLSWKEYQGILEREGKIAAYQRITTAMAGIPLDTLVKTTRKVMDCRQTYLQLEGEMIPVPRPNPLMQEVLVLLAQLNYEIYIISASNQFTVREVARHYLNVPACHSFGIVPELERTGDDSPILTDRLEQPLPITDGKEKIYFDRISSELPLVTGGDSDTDIFLMNLTHPGGIAIWRGDSGKKFQYINQNLKQPECLFTLDFKY